MIGDLVGVLFSWVLLIGFIWACVWAYLTLF